MVCCVSHYLLCSADSEVVLAVQQEDGSRVQGKFPSTATLWEVLSQLNVVGDQAAEPVLMYMSHKVGLLPLVSCHTAPFGVDCSCNLAPSCLERRT